MTRDVGLMGKQSSVGEDGPISIGISNFGFNTSPLFMLNTFEAIGCPMRLAGAAAGDAIAAAAVEARDDTCTSLSEAV